MDEMLDEFETIHGGHYPGFITGKLDRLDVAYTRFDSIARQAAVVETLLPLGSIGGADVAAVKSNRVGPQIEFLPSAESILEEVVPTSFKIKLSGDADRDVARVSEIGALLREAVAGSSLPGVAGRVCF